MKNADRVSVSAPSPAHLPTNNGSTSAEQQDDGSSAAVMSALGATVGGHFDSLRQALAGVCKELERLRESVAARAIVDPVHADMFERFRALNERFHDREVLQPIFRVLIGISDRCREQERVLQQRLLELDRAGAEGDERFILLRERKATRAGDRTEIENILTIFGVEAFHCPGMQFDPTMQKCIKRIPARDNCSAGRVAGRILPGYRRDGGVIRPEYVNVFVEKSTATEGE